MPTINSPQFGVLSEWLSLLENKTNFRPEMGEGLVHVNNNWHYLKEDYLNLGHIVIHLCELLLEEARNGL